MHGKNLSSVLYQNFKVKIVNIEKINRNTRKKFSYNEILCQVLHNKFYKLQGVTINQQQEKSSVIFRIILYLAIKNGRPILSNNKILSSNKY